MKEICLLIVLALCSLSANSATYVSGDHRGVWCIKLSDLRLALKMVVAKEDAKDAVVDNMLDTRQCFIIAAGYPVTIMEVVDEHVVRANFHLKDGLKAPLYGHVYMLDTVDKSGK